jgi:hypothetical protein
MQRLYEWQGNHRRALLTEYCEVLVIVGISIFFYMTQRQQEDNGFIPGFGSIWINLMKIIHHSQRIIFERILIANFDLFWAIAKSSTYMLIRPNNAESIEVVDEFVKRICRGSHTIIYSPTPSSATPNAGSSLAGCERKRKTAVSEQS